MNSAADILRRAADTLEGRVISGRVEKSIRLMGLHIMRACGSNDISEEARLLIELLDESA